MRVLMLVATALVLTACFWNSDPPDLSNNDEPSSLVVIWDRVIVNDVIERSVWLTSDEVKLKKIVRHLDTKSWLSSSVLPSGHLTRIILTMKSGKIWEISQSTKNSKSLKMFNRNDRCWSGHINWSEEFLRELTLMIESETGWSVDLTTEHREAIVNGALKKVITNTAQKQLDIYPGYPEIVWNKGKQKFEYTDD